MHYTKYNTKAELAPFGFHNNGSICYFNTLLQSFLSCTSYIELIKPSLKYDSEIIKLFYELLKDNSEGKDVSQHSTKILQHLIIKLGKNNTRGQQCASEYYTHLLNSINEVKEISNLFFHRHKTLIFCFDCGKCVSSVSAINNLIEIEPNLENEQIEKFMPFQIKPKNMNEFITKNSGYVDKDYICPMCKKKGEKYKINLLIMIPEILVIMSKKYNTKEKIDIITEFPEHLVFDNTGGGIISYMAVAQIEHIGSKNSGHYWVICRRKGGWFSINDMLISPSKFSPSSNTFMVFYHMI